MNDQPNDAPLDRAALKQIRAEMETKAAQIPAEFDAVIERGGVESEALFDELYAHFEPIALAVALALEDYPEYNKTLALADYRATHCVDMLERAQYSLRDILSLTPDLGEPVAIDLLIAVCAVDRAMARLKHETPS